MRESCVKSVAALFVNFLFTPLFRPPSIILTSPHCSSASLLARGQRGRGGKGRGQGAARGTGGG